MSPVATYRRLFSLTGPLYVVVAFLARLPLAMSQLGTLLLVNEVTGSYAAGGASAGALAVANAIGSPIAGGLTDRIGQRSVLLAQSLISATGMGALVWAAQGYDASQPWWILAAIAAVAGFFTPQIGTMARVRWRPISREAGVESRTTIDAAFSYEGAADEAAFVLGPAAVGLIAALINPGGSLLAAGALLALFGSWFAIHPTSRLVNRDAVRAAAATQVGRAALITLPLLLLAAIQLSVGMIFGSVQTGTSVLATAAGEPGLTGLLHATLGVGSVLAGLAVVIMPDSFRYESRLRVFTLALLALAVPLLWVGDLMSLAVVLLVLGLAVAPSMITTYTIVERTTAARRLGAAMTILAAITGLGYAVGSSIAGRLADWGGHTPAYAVTVCAAGLAALLSLAGSGVLSRAQERAAGPIAGESSPLASLSD